MIPDYPTTRVEFFLAAILGQDVELPAPQSRTELYLAAILGQDVTLPAPSCRTEFYLAKILGQDVELPAPQSRSDFYLASLAGIETDLPDPQTRLDAYLLEWAQNGGTVTVGPSAIASFSASKAAPLRKLEVAIEPWQNLNGFDHPWPSGGNGVNLLENKLTSGKTNNVNYEVYPQGYIHLNGTANADTTLVINDNAGIGPGTYIIKKTSGSGTGESKKMVVTVDGTDVDVTSTADVTVTATTGITQVALYIASGTSSSLDVYPMIRPSSVSSSDYVPYKNICPISGWTGVNISRANENLISEYGQHSLVTVVTSKVFRYYTSAGTSLLFRCAKGATYYLTRPGTIPSGYSSRRIWGFFKDYPVYGAAGVGSVTDSAADDNSTTAPFSGWCVIFVLNGGWNETYAQGCQVGLVSEQEVVTPATTTVSIDLPNSAGTVYGGTLDVVSGVLTVTHAKAKISDTDWEIAGDNFRTAHAFTGAGTSGDPICSVYKTYSRDVSASNLPNNGIKMGETGSFVKLVYIRDDRYDNVEDWITAMGNEEIVYPLASPVEYTLTPEQVSTLVGANNVWSDAGDVTLEYQK